MSRHFPRPAGSRPGFAPPRVSLDDGDEEDGFGAWERPQQRSEHNSRRERDSRREYDSRREHDDRRDHRFDRGEYDDRRGYDDGRGRYSARDHDDRSDRRDRRDRPGPPSEQDSQRAAPGPSSFTRPRSPPSEEALQAFLEKKGTRLSASDSAAREARIAQGGTISIKSRYQLEKEEAERKKKEQEEEAAKAYKEFVEAMDAPGASSSPSSSRWGGAGRSKATSFIKAGGGSLYAPSRDPRPSSSAPPTQPRAMANSSAAGKTFASAFGDAAEDDEDEARRAEAAAKARKDPPGKRKRAMDDFLGELQRTQAQREERLKDRLTEGTSVSSILAMEGQKKGSRDLGDPTTTNICVLNLPANISEQALGEFFVQWGDVATVKIMWPRGEESLGGAGGGITAFRSTRNAGFTGFVAFMRRDDAEFAQRETDGITWGGCVLRTGWGKAMPLPSRPLFTMPAAARRKREEADRGPGSASLARPRVGRARDRPHRRTHRPPRSPSPRTQIRHNVLALDEAKPQDQQGATERFVRTVADRVREYGRRFEDMIREKEMDNPEFAWLREEESPGYQYFKTLLDERYVPIVEAAPFADEGAASLYDSDSEEDSEAEHLRKQRRVDVLGRAARRRLEAMLRGITPRRERIARAMVFAIEHAHAAEVIAELIVSSLLIPTTPIARKAARLHVVSDILHNSAAPVPNAWRYRSAFEKRLPRVWDHLHDVTMSFGGRMKQEGVRLLWMAVLDIWEDWLVFPPSTIEEWKGRVEGRGSLAAKVEEVQDDVDGAPMEATASHHHDVDTHAQALRGDGASHEVRDEPVGGDGSRADGTQDDDEEEDLDGEAMVS